MRQLYGTVPWENKPTKHSFVAPAECQGECERHPLHGRPDGPSVCGGTTALQSSGDTASGETELSVLLEEERTRRWNLVSVAEAFDRMPNRATET